MRSAMGTSSIRRRSRHDTLRNRAVGSEELKSGRGGSNDIAAGGDLLLRRDSSSLYFQKLALFDKYE